MALSIAPLINGREYGWSDIIFDMGGVPVIGIRGIKYKSKQEKKNVYGAGNKPVSRSYGRKEFEASVTLLASTIFAVKEKAPNKRLESIAPFPITVMYQPESGPLVTETLVSCEFMEDGFDWKEGDTEKEIELPLIIADIKSK